MKDYKSIRRICELNISLSKTVIDDFLLYYAAAQYRLDRSMTEAFNPYRHITGEFEKEWINRMKAQYIAHKIFKAGGLIKKLLLHAELQKLNGSEIEFLVSQSQQPWRFCFSTIINNPAHDFYTMEDILTGESFTLFSPGTTDTLKTQASSLWFNLVAYNGDCWVTYGPIVPYKSFEVDDIYFFATELDPRIESEEDIANSIDQNPVPYMMLLSGANLPFTMKGKDQMIQNIAEYPVDKIDTVELKKDFTSAYSHGVYQFALKRWGAPPHFSQFYYDEDKKSILFSAMTDRGFQKLVSTFNRYGYKYQEVPDIRVNISMLVIAAKILKKKLELNPYEHLFHVETPPEDEEFMDRMNLFLKLILPEFNAGKAPDIEKHASTAGIDIESARDLVGQLMKKYGNFRK